MLLITRLVEFTMTVPLGIGLNKKHYRMSSHTPFVGWLPPFKETSSPYTFL